MSPSPSTLQRTRRRRRGSLSPLPPRAAAGPSPASGSRHLHARRSRARSPSSRRRAVRPWSHSAPGMQACSRCRFETRAARSFASSCREARSPACLRRLSSQRYPTLAGTVSQGSPEHGTFSARRGSAAPALTAPGSTVPPAAGRLAVVDDPYGPLRLVDLASGEVHALYADGAGFPHRDGLCHPRRPSPGRASFAATGGSVNPALPCPRASQSRQFEVRFPSGGAVLAGTLTFRQARAPIRRSPGSPARTDAARLSSRPRSAAPAPGVARLAYDKRGIAQSSGAYPGASPTADAIDLLARDAAAAARCLAEQPGTDPAPRRPRRSTARPAGSCRSPPRASPRSASWSSSPGRPSPPTRSTPGRPGRRGRPPAPLTDAEIHAQVLGAAATAGSTRCRGFASSAIPALWLFGGLDPQYSDEPPSDKAYSGPVAAEMGRDFSVQTSLANANHALVETQTGLTAEMLLLGPLRAGTVPGRARLAPSARIVLKPVATVSDVPVSRGQPAVSTRARGRLGRRAARRESLAPGGRGGGGCAHASRLGAVRPGQRRALPADQGAPAPSRDRRVLVRQARGRRLGRKLAGRRDRRAGRRPSRRARRLRVRKPLAASRSDCSATARAAGSSSRPPDAARPSRS